MLRYIELKTGYNDDGPAWIGRVRLSKSGQTVYFNGKAFKRGSAGASGNHYDLETGDSYWISGVKKDGQDRHRAGSGKITIEASAVAAYLDTVSAKELDLSKFEISDDIEPADPGKFYGRENELL
ncbi:MAG TPA: hypothetical protein VF179_12695 [Thermoanaerobaculia bacterium]|nr:hypothetical protein [Thermoanaerobaculia bacterium]